jgi:uracil-DNA glycosylase
MDDSNLRRKELGRVAADAALCQRCPLFEKATQVVFGEGPVDATIMMVGEQPGDKEDTVGRPFVGPAGHILDDALSEAGLDRSRIYVTNAVKHFKHTARQASSAQEAEPERNRNLPIVARTTIGTRRTEAHRRFGCDSST